MFARRGFPACIAYSSPLLVAPLLPVVNLPTPYELSKASRRVACSVWANQTAIVFHEMLCAEATANPSSRDVLRFSLTRLDGRSADTRTMTATYESLPIPPPSARSSSRANPSPTSSSSGVSAFSISGLKRLFGGAGSASSRAASRHERNRNRESIPEEEDGYRPSVAKRHLANVLTGVGPAPSAESERQSDDRYLHHQRDRSGSRSRTSSAQAPSPGEDSGTGAAASGELLQQGGRGDGSPARPSSEPRTHSSSSRSRSRSRPAASAATENQIHHHPSVLPDGQRFVRPIRLSGASPSVRVSLQNAETGAAIFSSSSGGQSYGSAGGGGGGGRLTSEFRFAAGQHDNWSPTLSEELPPQTALEEGRPRRLSFTSAIPGLSSFTGGRGGAGGGGAAPRSSLDDDARSIWSVGTGAKSTNPSAYEMMRRLRNEVSDEGDGDDRCFSGSDLPLNFRVIVTGSLDAVLDQGRVGQGLLPVRLGVHDLPKASPL